MTTVILDESLFRQYRNLVRTREEWEKYLEGTTTMKDEMRKAIVSAHDQVRTEAYRLEDSLKNSPDERMKTHLNEAVWPLARDLLDSKDALQRAKVKKKGGK